MTKPLLISLSITTAAVALIAVGYYTTRAACACGPEAAADTPAVIASLPAPSATGDTCSLSPEGRDEALQAFSAFAGEHLSGVEASVTARFDGDKPAIAAFLRDAIAREASCCSFLRFDLVETETGYAVTMSAEGAGVRELTAALDMMPLAR